MLLEYSELPGCKLNLLINKSGIKKSKSKKEMYFRLSELKKRTLIFFKFEGINELKIKAKPHQIVKIRRGKSLNIEYVLCKFVSF